MRRTPRQILTQLGLNRSMGVCKGFWKQHSPDGKTSNWRLTLPLSLSWDHRVIDGAAAARFNVYFANVLADLRRVLF